MAKIKFDVSSSDAEKATANYAQPTPGVYRIKIKALDVKKPDGKDRRIEAQYEIVQDKKFKGARLFDYINLESESSAWKLDQFLQAVGAASTKKRSGSFDTEALLGKDLMCRVKNELYQGEQRAKVGGVFALSDDEDEASEDSDEGTEDVDEEGEDEELAEDDEDESEEETDYSEWEISDLKAELKRRELSTKGKRTELTTRLEEDDAEDPFDE